MRVRFSEMMPASSSSFLPSFLAGPHLPALGCSGPRRISTASSRSQWASPHLLCQLLIAVGLAGPHLLALRSQGLAGPHLPALDRSGPRRTSTASSRSKWASPDLNRRESERPQPARLRAQWASPDPNRTSTARNKAI